MGAVFIKDESRRFGLEAFKTVGVTYAMHKLGREAIAGGVVCATAGNHGRAVARAAREAGVACTIFVPSPTATATPTELAVRTARVNAMRRDRADVVEVDGTYEEAVGRAAEQARRTGAVMLSDTASTETDPIARWIMAGYTRLFSEASTQWPSPPDVVLVQGGVGGLVAAAASWFAFHQRGTRPTLIACEPEAADCLLESAREGHPLDLSETSHESPMVRGPRVALDTVMAGLRCAKPSAAAWPGVRDGIDAFVSIPDALALDALERLAHPLAGDAAIAAGPSGACGVGTLLALVQNRGRTPGGDLCRMDRSTSVLAIVTEGA